MKLTRRTFMGTAAAASMSAPAVYAGGHGKPRVVVVGGGAGGATAARYIAKDSKGAIDVTLVEPCLLYTSPSPRDRQKSRMPSSA